MPLTKKAEDFKTTFSNDPNVMKFSHDQDTFEIDFGAFFSKTKAGSGSSLNLSKQDDMTYLKKDSEKR